MRNASFFTQSCPACGRRLHVATELLGNTVGCRHCRAEFVACDPAQVSVQHTDWRTALLQRADELLALLARKPEFA